MEKTMADLSPEAVARRLEALRALYVPEDIESARRRVAAERPPRRESFDEAVTRRLEELRALLELTDALKVPAD